MSPKTTSWVTVLIGAIVTAVGQMMRPSELGSGIMGFGLAHIVLGLLDMARPTVREAAD